MPLITLKNGLAPQLGEDCWVAPTAMVSGDVVMGRGCTVWFNAVVRGDVHSIRIGEACNIQDNAILHCTYQRADLVLGSRVSIGHSAIVHGCQIGSEVLIGMGSIVMDHAHVPDRTIVAAGAIVTQGMQLESGYIYAGQPARKLKEMTPEHLDMIMRTAANYPEYARLYA